MKKQASFKRGAGILLPIFSLPSTDGIGTLGKPACEFVDFLLKSGQKFWQVLPIGPTLFGNSPYQSSSAFAGNPLLIYTGDYSDDDNAPTSLVNYIDYDGQYEKKNARLHELYEESDCRDSQRFNLFCEKEKGWLDDFAIFSAIKEGQEGRAWYDWSDKGLRDHDPAALERFVSDNEREIEFQKYVQYLFFTQWKGLRDYANGKGISIIGDMPIYVSLDSADVWACREDYLLDSDGKPIKVAGVPPDRFSSSGQLWGNPIYNWSKMKENGFKWWQDRYRSASALYDVIRIDHFVGIVNYYAIPASDGDAVNGEWQRGPSYELIEAIKECNGAMIIAEDLGNVTDEVRDLMNDAGYPGMRILQFGLDDPPDNLHSMKNCPENCIAYGGTHDNETLRGFVSRMGDGERRRIMELSGAPSTDERALTESLIRLGLESHASIAIFQLQDYLMLGNEARINLPSTLGGRNWRWTLGDTADRLDAVIPLISALTESSGR